MNTTVILTDANDTNLSRSLVSILESTVKPKNVLMLFGSQVTDNKWATAKAIMGGCCGAEPPIETVSETVSVVSNYKYDINFYACKFKEQKSVQDLQNFAIQQDPNTDVFFTLSSGTAYGENFIEKCLLKFEDPLIRAVYSDYYVSGKEVCLQSFNSMMTSKIDVKEIAFRNNSNLLFKSDNFTLLTEIYNNGIISHIPEFLVST